MWIWIYRQFISNQSIQIYTSNTDSSCSASSWHKILYSPSNDDKNLVKRSYVFFSTSQELEGESTGNEEQEDSTIEIPLWKMERIIEMQYFPWNLSALDKVVEGGRQGIGPVAKELTDSKRWMRFETEIPKNNNHTSDEGGEKIKADLFKEEGQDAEEEGEGNHQVSKSPLEENEKKKRKETYESMNFNDRSDNSIKIKGKESSTSRS